MLEDHTLSGDVLQGATSAQGDPLSITQFVVNGQTYNAGDTAQISDASRPPKWQKVGELTIRADGTYTFVPSDNWNGQVPPIEVTMTDGTNTSVDTLIIDVTPVNDAPFGLHHAHSASAAAGEAYTFKLGDFQMRDWHDSDAVNLNDTPITAPSAIIIARLPPEGGTILFDGVPVALGTKVSAADLTAGRLTFQVDSDYRGGQLQPFYFQVVDGGGTDDGGVETSVGGYMFRLDVGQIMTGSNFNNVSNISNVLYPGIVGGSGKDILIGDAGGVVERQVDANADLNIALVINIDAFSTQTLGTSGMTREAALKDALGELLNNQLLAHAGKVNVSLMTFDATGSTNHITITDLNAGNIKNILDAIAPLTAANHGNQPFADYAHAFKEAEAWFNSMAAGGYGGYENQTFFLTNAYSSGNADGLQTAFDALKQVSGVYATFMDGTTPRGRPLLTEAENLARYDTSGSPQMVADALRYVTHADFQDTNGANNINAWEKSGTGDGVMAISNGQLIIGTESSTGYVGNRNTIVTQKEANKMVVSDPDGAYFSFSISAPNGQQAYFSNYMWRLLKWDAATADWVVAESGGDSHGAAPWNKMTITTSHQPAGEYRLQFESIGLGFYTTPTGFLVDDIRIHKPVFEGNPQYVNDLDQLKGALSINGTVVNPVGGDRITAGTVGDSILFGDALNADGLDWGQNGNPPKPPDLHGLDALKYFLQASLGHAPTHAEIFDYIWANHEKFYDPDDTQGGRDTIQGGQWNTLAYGGGGDDVIFGGIGGNNNILYGGAGNDQIRGASSGNNTIIGGSGNDTLTAGDFRENNTFVWLDGDAGTVGVPAIDRVNFFSLDRSVGDPNKSGSDKLDLSDLLINEENSADLSKYLNFSLDSTDTVINVSTTGNLDASGNNFDQQIRLSNIDLIGGFTGQNEIIAELIKNGTLLVDQ